MIGDVGTWGLALLLAPFDVVLDWLPLPRLLRERYLLRHFHRNLRLLLRHLLR